MENTKGLLAIATKHSERNSVPAVEGRKCVDGGYRKDQSPGMIARPGADLGYVMALLLVNKEKKLGLTPQQCFDTIYNAVTKNGGKFYMHTDQHSGHGHSSLIGCGHALKSTLPENTNAYGISPEEITEVVKYALEKSETDSNMVNIHLDREHQELGILRVKGTKKTVNPWDQEENTMFFVYDKTRDNEFMKSLCTVIASEGMYRLVRPEAKDPVKDRFAYNDLKSASDRQLIATLRIIAPGKPILDVNVDPDSPTITYTGNVE